MCRGMVSKIRRRLVSDAKKQKRCPKAHPFYPAILDIHLRIKHAILLLLLMDNKTQYNTVFGVRNMMHGQTQTNFIVVRGAGYYLELIYGPQRVVNRQQMIRGQ